MIDRDQYIHDELGPGGGRFEREPVPELQHISYMISGRVFDQTTTSIGRGLYVSAYQLDASNNLIFKKRVLCRADGSYCIKFLVNEIIIDDDNKPIELFVYQGRTQLSLIGDGKVIISAARLLNLKDLLIASSSSVKGVIKRKNFVNAAGCLVELYNDKNNDPTSATFIENASAFTNINGEYKIPYSGEVKNTLRLKFYNNEDILSRNIDENVSDLNDTPALIEEEKVASSGKSYSEGEWFEVVTATESKVYEYVSNVDSDYVNAKLVSWIDESTSLKEVFYKRDLYKVDENDPGNYYLVLDKQVVFDTEGKWRETYIRIPESLSPESPTLHNKLTENYNFYWSPQVVTTNQEEDVSYLFTKNTLDDYTRITNREEEFVSAKESSDNTIPVRSKLKGYNAEETSAVASLIGATEDDVQDLSQARDFNSQMRLDHEAILFGLVKKGVNLDIAVLFSMSDKVLKAKIQEAINDHIIPELNNIDFSLGEIKTGLTDIVAADFEDIFEGVSDTTIQAINTDSDKKSQFIKTMAKYTYDDKPLNAKFWAELSLEDVEKQQLRSAVEYSEVCNNNEDFINLFVESGTNELKPLRALLNMSKAEIEALISPEILASEDVPEGIATAEAYADYIYKQIEDKYATKSLLYDFANTNIEGDTELITKFNLLRAKLITGDLDSTEHFFDILFTAEITFNIEQGPVRDFLETGTVDTALTNFYTDVADALSIPVDPEAKWEQGKKEWINFMTIIQRVYSVTTEGKFETIKALIEENYLSAFDIVKAGRTNFMSKMAGELGEEKCIKIFKAAEYKVNKALSILNKYSGSSNSGMPIVVKGKEFKAGDESQIQLLSLPQMSMLFGDQDVTDTKHCESVLGPAAYLVDVLNVLKQFKVSEATGKETLYDKLIERRPDIAQIPLNCANAVTPLPYIDLVMEVLESAIYYNENGSYKFTKWDTTKTEDQLKTDPEYTHYSVYDKIKKNTISSWLTKPFDLYSEELKIFAKTLGINRTKLAEPYSNIDNAANPYFDVLGLTNEEQVLFPANSVETDSVLNFVFESVFGANPDPVPTRLPIKDFLENSLMTLDEFKTLIGSYYVNPFVTDGTNDQRFTIHYDGKQELSTAFLDFASENRLKAFMMRMYQFRRLMMVTEWSAPVLDSIILLDVDYKSHYDTINTNNNLITSNTVEHIGRAKMNQEYLGLSDDKVAFAFGKAVVLDYDESKSVINRYFIDNNQPEEYKEIFKKWLTLGDATGAPVDELVYTEEDVPHLFMQYLQEAMKLDDDELLALSSLMELNVDGKLIFTAHGIQNIVRAWQLADAYGLKIEEFVSYCQFIQFDVTKPLVDSVDTLTDAQKIVIANQTNLLDLMFLLNHQSTTEELQEFDDKALKIANNIVDKKEEFKPKLEEGEEAFTQKQKLDWADAIKPVIEEQLKLATNLDLAIVTKGLALKTIDGKDVATYLTDPGNDDSLYVKYNLIGTIKLCLKGFSLCELMGIESTDIDHMASSPVTIFDLPMGTDKELQEFENRALKITNNIIDKKVELTPELLEGEATFTQDQKVEWADALKPIIEAQLKFTTNLDLTFVAKVLALKTIDGKDVASYLTDPGNDEFSDVKNNLIATIKFCLKGLSLCELMGIELADIDDVADSLVAIIDLPMNTAQAVLYDDFAKFSAVCQADQYLIEGKNRFEFYNQILTKDKASLTLSDYIDWDSVLTDWQHNDELESTKYNSNLQWFLQAGEISQFLNRYDISSSDALKLIKWNWTGATEAEAVAKAEASVRSIASMAQAKANSEIYASEMTSGRNKLRLKQRDALVHYLFEKDGAQFTDIYDLYSYFLIDTQMTPAVSSSRILQATLTVQAFIQRIQLGLETDIAFTKKDAKKWEWMNLYRVWEANRKIFLYPENWLEPELRDNKTPFFKELEKELTGKEITKEAVDSSYMDYISKFEQVANIEICQMYNEEHDSVSVLHVIGRSRFEPREYFYRKLVNESYWTPWEKMGIEINTEHIAPAIIKDRLVAFWLECTDVAKKPTDSDLSIKNPAEGTTITPKSAREQLQMQVCWSELIDNKWTRKRKCEEKVLINETGTDGKYAYRLVFDKGETNYLHILNLPKSYHNDNRGYTFSVDCFNHVHLEKQSRFEGKDFIMPQGMTTHGQKAQMNNSKDWLSLPVAANNGIAYSQNVVENIKGETRLVYPHQYKNFICNSPFVVETNMQSVVFIPTVKAERSSVLLEKVIRHIYTAPIYRPVRKLYRAEYNWRHHEERRSYDEEILYDDRYDNYETREGRRRYRMPKFFTYEHEEMCLVKEGSVENVIAYENVNKELLMLKPASFKPKVIAGLAYHPYMETLRSNLQKYGIEGILDPLGVDDKNHKLLPQQANKNYLRDFEFNSDVVKNVLQDVEPVYDMKYIAEKFEYDSSGAYSLYNWELFFHIPFLLANRFLIEGNFKEALKWMHYIFDPRETEGESPSKYWKFKPFVDYNATKGIDDLLVDLNLNGDDDPENVELNKQIEMWSTDPFKPHNIAQMRPGAYMKAVVMRYLDIIIAHGDDLFRIDTTESINEATQYYMIAAQLLGRKPEVVETEILAVKSFDEMETDSMSNAIEYFEEGIIKPENAAYLEKYIESNELEIASKPFSKDKDLKNMLIDVYGSVESEGDVAKLYFGIPKNNKMMAYWDRVADRLFKVRNSLNIDGIKRTVALFAPPIDPGLLIRARLAGISIADVMSMKDANPTEYRFQTLLQRALEICSEVKSLGSQLLSALEKGETEKISVLRASHEKALTELVTGIKEKSIEEAEVAIEQVKLQQENTQFRESYYRKKKKISGKEQQQLNFMDKAMKLQVASQALQTVAGALAQIPNVTAGASGLGSPVFTIFAGGTALSQVVQMESSSKSIKASVSNHKGSKAGIIAGYERRKQDWTFQADVAKRELEQLKQQEVSAEIRKEIALLDQRNHEKQVEQTQESYDVLSSKFTNEQLYLWMAGEINTLYRSAFDMAYKMAKQAEGAYNYELCPNSPRLPLATDYFNAQNKGLLAGEKLYMELKKMEADYLKDNKRKFELTKHVSLAMLDPQKILDLRSGGTCSIELPEVLFDLDHPGHFKRRIKSVSLTIPCVAGAYTSISADLSLINSSIVTNADREAEGAIFSPKKKITKMATSSGVNDSGLFELNFSDARYLPFEGAGAASQWTLTMPNTIRQFDYNSINDVIMHINYTAEDAGNRVAVETALVENINKLVEGEILASMFSLKAQYPEAWAKVGTEDVTIEIKKSQLPFYLQGQSIDVTGAERTILSGKDQAVQVLTGVATGPMGATHSVTIPVAADVSNADDLMIVLKYEVATS
ncbi:Tc toxin subunit A [Ancylomarina sp. DW003]|nr:neuraminidase-like domain-containing protein [Ancylomarina sp. DW003]MDE5420604.1 Tc toxin subunit A [Ancylomarina sp. DW003]